MYDSFNRHINYLRISVTDRCNLRCRYCMPEEGVKLLKHEDILSFEEVTEVVKEAVSLGIDKIRFTGGEPLVRKGMVELVAKVAAIPGIRDLAMTTNGIYLEKMALPLKQAGLMRINVSLDTVNPEKFAYITRGGNIEDVFRGIEAARKAGLDPVKINTVLFSDWDRKDAEQVKEFGQKHGLEVRFIHQMNLKTGSFSIVEGGEGGNCSRCNRIRLTANGMVKPCLFDEQEFSVRSLGAKQAIVSAISHKPQKGCHNNKGSFYNIGG